MKRKRQLSDKVRHDIQKYSVCDYFSNDEHWARVKPFITGDKARNHGLSKRMCDHFVTNFARARPCEVTKEGVGLVNFYQRMQSVLVGLNKKLIDPFKRKQRGGDNFVFRGVTTNVCQLSFFRWALIDGALDYMVEHVDEIREDMLAQNHAPESAKLHAPTERIVVHLPPEMFDDDKEPGEEGRTLITLNERMQQPRRRRKRVRQDKVESMARFSSNVPLLSFSSTKF